MRKDEDWIWNKRKIEEMDSRGVCVFVVVVGDNTGFVAIINFIFFFGFNDVNLRAVWLNE